MADKENIEAEVTETPKEQAVEKTAPEKEKDKKFITDDNQLRAAINLMHGIKIYKTLDKKIN